jgi:hypothetical protein
VDEMGKSIFSIKHFRVGVVVLTAYKLAPLAHSY